MHKTALPLILVMPVMLLFRGVFWDKKTGRWRSQLGFQNRKIFMGYFDTAEEAAAAYDQKAVELHGRLGGNPETDALHNDHE